MPFMICEYADPLDAATRERVAKSITRATHDVIGSPLDLINVVLRQPDRNQIWLAGEPSDVAIILFFIRAGRSQARRTELALRMSKAWHEAVGTPESSIEVAVFETPAALPRAEKSCQSRHFPSRPRQPDHVAPPISNCCAWPPSSPCHFRLVGAGGRRGRAHQGH
jgi:phenylpyruvate tautomerase PptA (4-oxalocrotonate tautomerase family)